MERTVMYTNVRIGTMIGRGGGEIERHQPARKARLAHRQRVPRTLSPHRVIDTFEHAVLDASSTARDD